MGGESGVNMVEILALGLRKNGMETKQGSKIIERHSRKGLLLDEYALFGMKMCQRKGNVIKLRNRHTRKKTTCILSTEYGWSFYGVSIIVKLLL